jgi:hypothetical protein
LVEPNFSDVPAVTLLQFDSNAFKKKNLDQHDQVISLLHETGDNEFAIGG